MSERKERCETCRFCDQFAPDDLRRELDYIGTCRRMPPVHLPSVLDLLVRDDDEQYEADKGEKMTDFDFRMGVTDEAGQGHVWGWPTVSDDDWCGEWQPIPADTPPGTESA
jgi:hypothetical protein